MALFQKKQPDVGSSMPIYSLGLQKHMLIVGLGNVGKDYADTRHNIGFKALDALAEKQEMEWAVKKDLKSVIATGNIGDTRVVLCKPTTMMNVSGEAVQAVSHFYKIQPTNVIVVHDELDIPFGQIRTRVGGSSAGNNGIKSVSEHIGEDYGRVRIGIGPKKPATMDSADFVLQNFSAAQQKQIKHLLQETTAILTETIHGNQLTPETRTFLV